MIKSRVLPPALCFVRADSYELPRSHAKETSIILGLRDNTRAREKKEVRDLPQLNQQELQILRHLVGAEDVTSKQFSLFAQQCNDPQLKGFLQNTAAKAEQDCRALAQFLQV
jgi:hypothetical protein